MRWWRVLVLCAAVVGCCCAGSVQAEEAGPLVFRLYVPQYHAQAPVKLGLSGASAEQAAAIGGNWYYNWGTYGRNTDDVEFVPMIWGEREMTATIPVGTRWLLGFNEPDGQSLISPERAAQLWRELELRHARVKLVSPAPSHLDPNWLMRMRDAYIALYGQPPRFDAIAFHGYFATAAELIALAELYIAWAEEWGVPEVWCTEYAFLPGWNANWAQETRAWLAWVARTPRLTRHSPFIGYIEIPHWSWPTGDPLLDPSLFTAQGGTVLTDIGRAYAGRN
jgi:hypothetical protein